MEMLMTTATENAPSVADYGLLTVAEACNLLGLGDESVKNRIQAGALPGVKAGPVWLVPIAGIARTLEAEIAEGSRSARTRIALFGPIYGVEWDEERGRVVPTAPVPDRL